MLYTLWIFVQFDFIVMSWALLIHYHARFI